MVVASKDGTNLWSANDSLPADKPTQVGKMITLNNIHIGDTGVPQNDGTDFESRATVHDDDRISTSANTPYPFTVQGRTFNKWRQIALSNSKNAVRLSSACTTNRFPSPRWASTIHVVRPSRSRLATQPQVHPALLRSSAMISQYFIQSLQSL